MTLPRLRSLFTGKPTPPTRPADAAQSHKPAATASRSRPANATLPALSARPAETLARPVDRPSPQPSLRRQNAVLPERGSAAMRSAWLSLPTGAKGPLAQLMSPPVEQALPEGSRGPLAALMHHDARSESIQAAQRLSPRDTDDQALAIAEAPLGPGANSDGWDTVQADSTSEIVPAEDGPPPRLALLCRCKPRKAWCRQPTPSAEPPMACHRLTHWRKRPNLRAEAKTGSKENRSGSATGCPCVRPACGTNLCAGPGIGLAHSACRCSVRCASHRIRCPGGGPSAATAEAGRGLHAVRRRSGGATHQGLRAGEGGLQ